ncbi:MAG: hypothetical protein HY721_09065 [Planctomycetes bacterium]|nr:hypothetical protein [Planctomycetota bacterium]
MSPWRIGTIAALALVSGSAVSAFVLLRRYRVRGLECLRFGLLSLGAGCLLSIQVHLYDPGRPGSTSPAIVREASFVLLWILDAGGWTLFVVGLAQLLRARGAGAESRGGDPSAGPTRRETSLRTAGGWSLGVCGVLTLIGSLTLDARPYVVPWILSAGIGLSLACRLWPAAGLARALAVYWTVLLLLFGLLAKFRGAAF